MTTLFFDLDGTLIDVTQRHVTVYHTVAKKMKLQLLSDSEYLTLKQQHLFPVPEDQKELFRNVYKEESEHEAVLPLDTIIPGISQFLEEITRTHRCILVTKRYHREHLFSQLKNLSLLQFFEEVLTPNPESKADAIKTLGYSDMDIVIGDTEEDIETAVALGITSIAVTWGVRSRAFLETFSPTYIVENVHALTTIVQSQNGTPRKH